MRRISCLVGLVAVGLVLPSGAPAAVTIGQNGPALGCGDGTAVVQDPNTASGTPLYAPSSYGVITSWSIMADANPAGRTVMLLVLRPNFSAGPSQYITTAKDQVRSYPLPSQLNTFTSGVRLPIEAGERLGLYVPTGQPGGIGICVFSATGVIRAASPGVEPALNVSMDYPVVNPNLRLNASAQVEPDADRDVFGDETQDNCVGTPGTVSGCPNTLTLGKAKAGKNKVTVEATVPGAGTLQAGSATDKALAAAKKKKKRARPPLKQASQTLTSKTKQTVKLVLSLSKTGKAKLARNGKLGLSIKVLYTPPGGAAGVATASAKLRKKTKKR